MAVTKWDRKVVLSAWNVHTLLDREDTPSPQRRTVLTTVELTCYKINIAAPSETNFLRNVLSAIQKDMPSSGKAGLRATAIKNNSNSLACTSEPSYLCTQEPDKFEVPRDLSEVSEVKDKDFSKDHLKHCSITVRNLEIHTEYRKGWHAVMKKAAIIFECFHHECIPNAREHRKASAAPAGQSPQCPIWTWVVCFKDWRQQPHFDRQIKAVQQLTESLTMINQHSGHFVEGCIIWKFVSDFLSQQTTVIKL